MNKPNKPKIPDPVKMRKYLSFGGGVNSVAMMLLMLEKGEDFEAVFVNHGTDWPETYKYLDMFQEWLDKRGCKPITVLKPNVEGFDNLYDYCLYKKIVPSRQFRWCTDKFKIKVIYKYVKPLAIMYIGFDFNEQKRMKDNYINGIINKYPLIKAKMTRDDCKWYILDRSIYVPKKSGCYICPYQGVYEVKWLRKHKLDLYLKAKQLEDRVIQERKKNGKKPIYLFGSHSGKSINAIVEENQIKLFKRDEYPDEK